MSERMTDERLAEIERAVFDVEGWPVNCSEELLQALKADRAEVERLWEWKAETLLIDWRERAEAAEAKLRAAEAFPNVLRARSEEYTHLSETGRALDAAADELEALLK